MDGAIIVLELGCSGGGVIKGEETDPWIIGAVIAGECLHDPFLG